MTWKQQCGRMVNWKVPRSAPSLMVVLLYLIRSARCFRTSQSPKGQVRPFSNPRNHFQQSNDAVFRYRRNLSSWTALEAARSSPSSGSKKSNSKRASGSKRYPTKPSYPSSTSKMTSKSVVNSTKRSAADSASSIKNSGLSNQPPPQRPSQRSPPWQVLSEKEAKQNIVQEKERRAKAQQGIQMPKSSSSSITPADRVISAAFLSTSDRRFMSWKRFPLDRSPAVNLRLVGSFIQKSLPPSLGVPEVAFLGRSNVGKSSLLNRLVSMVITSRSNGSGGTDAPEFARVGKTPGATASVNLYALSDAKSRDLLGLVDLPGFGYAKLSKQVQESVQETAEHYLGNRRPELALGILLVDIRRVPSDDDRAVLAALYDMGVPLIVIATKMDKITSTHQRQVALTAIQQGLGLPVGQPFCVSSVTGEGCRDLWKIILEACETTVDEFRQQYTDEKTEDDDEGENFDDFVRNDEQGEEDEDIVYSQGYDWIHSSVEDYDEDQGNDEESSAFIDDKSLDIRDGNADMSGSSARATKNGSFRELKGKLKRLKKRRGL